MRHFLAPHREIRYLGWLTPGLFVTTTSNFVTTRATTRNGFPTEGIGDWISKNPRKISLSLPPSLSIFPGSFFFSSSPVVPVGTASTSFGKKLTGKWNGNGPSFPPIHHRPRDETTETSRQGLEITRVFPPGFSAYPRTCTRTRDAR